MIDGYQRSANTFAVRAFEHCQSKIVRINSHNHNPPAIIAAIEVSKPVILLVRQPEDAIASWTIRSRFPLHYTIRSYIRFYQALEPYLSRACIATFDEVASNFSGVIERLNARYNSSFNSKAVDAKTTAEIFNRIENDFRKAGADSFLDEMKVSRPSAERQEIKAFLLNEMAGAEYMPSVAKARALFNHICAVRAHDPFTNKVNRIDARPSSLAIK